MGATLAVLGPLEASLCKYKGLALARGPVKETRALRQTVDASKNSASRLGLEIY